MCFEKTRICHQPAPPPKVSGILASQRGIDRGDAVIFFCNAFSAQGRFLEGCAVADSTFAEANALGIDPNLLKSVSRALFFYFEN